MENAVIAAGACIVIALLAVYIKGRIMRCADVGNGISVSIIIRAGGNAPGLEQALRNARLLCGSGEITVIDEGLSPEARRIAELFTEENPQARLAGYVGETECRQNSSTSE